jgi:hypothetical protein
VALPPPAAAVAGDSDHDQMVGRFAVGYLGRRTMLIGNGLAIPETPATAEQAVRTVAAPVIGIRYWISSLLGIDGGIGFFYDAGSNKTDLRDPIDPLNANPPINQTHAGTTTFIFHVGVPLALAGAKHFSFQVIPEANVGFSGQTIRNFVPAPGVAPGELTNRGFHLDIGARAGAEIHFGFMNIPQLSLQGSIGLLYAMDRTSSSFGPSESSRTRHTIATTVNDNPWNIFTSNVAALYYF